ncbi:LON peptidase substrate-binding domain-containing protein [Thalassotalea atypica]|uniref:LON peptidase substrate-binding domain-containing protein n=1 Tax=Thalassotalea atypica TaxID=2054316 RepID=UPI0025746071|nr:LON peptidase substrate-binding domain-containing protein [Thalassotalea atypica]
MSCVEFKLPIFPLPLFLLPGGITRLRIFERRYLKMVRVASQGAGFIIWSDIDGVQEQKVLWGSWVEIINFDHGKDGVLEIDVKCKSLVEIKGMEPDNDKLMFGQVIVIEHWSENDIGTISADLSYSLQKVFENDKGLNELYQIKEIDNESWVLARWLELLPLAINIKNSFVSKHTYTEAKNFIQAIILK